MNNDITLPESFEKLSIKKLFLLVDRFIEKHKSEISPVQLKNWSFLNQVPTLFLNYVKDNGFSFPPNTLAFKIKNPKLGFLVQLIKEPSLKISANEVKHPNRNVKKVKLKQKRTVPLFKLNKCERTDCSNNNDNICSSTPVKPNQPDSKNGIIIDCLRFHSKDSKIKSIQDVMVVFSEPDR